jgi:hypothetical protein
MFLDDAIVEAVQTESNLLVARRIVVVAEHLSDGVGRDHQGAPSLVDVLCTLAAHWVLCECGLEIGKAGRDGWAKEGLQLDEKIDSLNTRIPDIESPSKKAAMPADLEKLEAQSKALNEEWGQTQGEADAYRELFWTAREFCKNRFGIGGKELLNAALVGFDPERLQPGQGPSQHRMTELAMLLSNLKRDIWESLPWANPTKPTMRVAKRVAQNKRDSFIVRNLKHISTVAGPFEQDNPLNGLNAEVKPASASPLIDIVPYLGLRFHHDSTVSRIGSDYAHLPLIPLAPQPLKLLKFIHDAGERGRTVNELVPAIIANKRILTTEKSRLNLSEIDIDLGPAGQYVVRCTKANTL